MAFWRQLSTIVTGSLLIGCLNGCTPASNSPLDEEKDPHVVQGRNRETGYDWPGAIEAYQHALDANPHNSVAHYRLGFLYEKEDRDPAAAIYHFQRYLNLRPNSEHAEVIRQHILGCKQSLAKDVSLGPVSGEMQRRLNELLQQTQVLAEENRRLTEQLARLQRGSAPGGGALTDASASQNRPADPQPGPPLASGRTHTVQKGETYYSIARRYGISTSSLGQANPGVDPTRLKIGQQLALPSR